MFAAILDFIFPPRCAACKEYSESTICSNCSANITYLHHINRNTLPIIYSTAVYEGVIKKALNAFKFHNKIRLARTLAELMIKTAEKNNIMQKHDIDLIIPVPVHKNTIKNRGYNQSELLARAIGERFSAETKTNALVKIKDTAEQNKLNKEERLVNLKGSFAMNEFIESRNILLIDDVYTTGATAKECIKVLRSNKSANKIIVLTLARAV